MDGTLAGGVTELPVEDQFHIEGGSGVPVARYIASCFGAGFTFGYEVLGPALFG